MPDDDTIIQIARDRQLLSDQQIEAALEEIRNAADAGEEIAFLDAAVRRNLLSPEQARQLREEADKAISTAETEEIQPALPADSEIDTAPHEPEPPSEVAAGQPAAPATGEQPAATSAGGVAGAQQKPLQIAMLVGLAVLIILTILAAILNR